MFVIASIKFIKMCTDIINTLLFKEKSPFRYRNLYLNANSEEEVVIVLGTLPKKERATFKS